MNAPSRLAVLMFHDVRRGGPASGYAVEDAALSRVAAIAAEAARTEGHCPLVLTFDDGCEGTFRNAPPILEAAGLTATLFVTTDFVGRAGFGDPAMLRSWVDAGLEIGSHGVTHRPLSLLPLAQARRELEESKARLEDWTGRTVTAFSYPGGNDSPALHPIVREAGYVLVYTSRPAFARTDRPVRPRFTIRAGTPFDAVRSLARGRLPAAMWPDLARWTLKRLVGAGPYRAVRRVLRAGA